MTGEKHKSPEAAPPSGPGLLASFLGSEAAAQRWRRHRDLRERQLLLSGLARDLRELAGRGAGPDRDADSLARDVRILENQLADVTETVRLVLDNLPSEEAR